MSRFSELLATVLLSAILGAPNALPAATYEVAQRSPQASDDAPGTTARPWKTLAKAAEAARPGDLILIRSGVYRERVVLKTSGTAEAPVRLEAAPGEHVVLTGADRLTGWKRLDPGRHIYSVAWPHRFITWNPHMTHPDDEYHRLIGRCEQVIIDGYLLRQVLEPDQLAPGAFCADTTNQVLLVWDRGGRDPNKTFVEASLRQEILRLEGDYIRVRGLHFRYAANMAQHGAVVLAGRGDALEDCEIESMNSSGATFQNQDLLVRGCVFRNNGQLGFGASHAHSLLFTQCVVENNNTKAFDRGWEAGGNKLVLCRGAVLERSRFIRNHGNGIWFDIGNTNCTVRNCLMADNDDAGIFYEISYHLHAHDNVIVGNGFAETAGAWGAQAGIALSSSPGCLIERNVIAGNREGFNFREQLRTTPIIEDHAERPVWNHDERIDYNLIALNRDAQIWGWFDVRDNRHWPAHPPAPGRVPPAADRAPESDLAAPYSAKSKTGPPQGLTLEGLRLAFEHNVYFAAPGQGWFAWGTTWGRHKLYSSLSEFQSDLGIDAGSETFDPGFADWFELDFRPQPATAARLKEVCPQGTVPGVALMAGDRR